MAGLAIRQQARPLMNALADATGAHVSLGLRDRLNIVLVQTSASPMRIAQRGPMADVGLSLPIVGSAIGHAFLAGCDASLRESLLNEIRVKAPDDWAAFEPGMRSALREYARHGFCSVDGTLVPEVLAVGTCIPAGRGTLAEPMVFNCAFVRSALPATRGAAWLRAEVGPKLKAMVDRLRSDGVVAGLRRG
jgi:DNA-binding IclR family transcriptional regulator